MSKGGKRAGFADARDMINAKLRQKDARSLIQSNRNRNYDARGLILANRFGKTGDARSIINKRQAPVLTTKDRTMVIPQKTVRNELYFASQRSYALQSVNLRRNTEFKTPPAKIRGNPPRRNDFGGPMNLKITRDVSPEPRPSFTKPLTSASASAPISPLQGFKLQVRNLHPSVTNDDLYELFSSIGRLRQCRLLRPGVGEVVYNEREDAVNAINQYNTRELDGQPMSVQLITSSSSVTAAVQKRNPRPPLNKQRSQEMEVEYETVTKALFNVSNQPNVRRPVNFVVNM